MPSVAFTVFVPKKGLFVSFLDRCEDLEYTAAHRGTVERPAGEVDAEAWTALLETIYADGNGMGEGEGFTVAGRSMSVGDVVTLDGGGTWTCDSFGWRELSPEESARFALDAEACPPRTFDPIAFAEQYHPAAPLPNGLITYVQRSDIGPDAPVPTEVAVAGTCRVTGDFFALEHVPLKGLGDWIGGMAIQNALPGLRPAEREFIKSAIRPGALAGRR